MGLIERIKSLLGLGTTGRPATTDRGGRSGSRDVDVTVEHEPATASEDAVKGTETSGRVGSTDEAGRDAADVDLQDIKGIGPTYADRLRDAGVESVTDLAAADAEALDEETGIGPNRLRNWIERARER